jgi:hypothetical protein
VNTVADCTTPEKILLAAFELEEQGQSPFSAEALIVAAWQKFPRNFGLKGYTDQYPDSNKVLSSIMGERGLTRRGLLSKMGQKLYAITREGRQLVRRLQHGEEKEEAGPAKLPREQDKFLLGLFASAAVEKFEEGRKQDLNFADASRFWGLTEDMHSEALSAKLDKVRATLADIDRQIGSAGADLSNGRSISGADLDLLSKVHDFLREKFSRHLSLLRNRAVRS